MNPGMDRIQVTEAVLAQFVTELAEAPDSRAVVEDYCRRYPDLEAQVRSQAAMIKALDELGASAESQGASQDGRGGR